MTRVSPWLTSILEEHFDELEMLWDLRRGAAWDEDYTVEDIDQLDERLEAHVDGLLLSREHVTPMLIDGLGADESPKVFASAYALLRINEKSAAAHVLGAIENGSPEQLSGICQALCYAKIDNLKEDLRAMMKSAPPPVQAVAVECLAFHGQLKKVDWQNLFDDDDTEVCCRAWRAAAHVSDFA